MIYNKTNDKEVINNLLGKNKINQINNHFLFYPYELNNINKNVSSTIENIIKEFMYFDFMLIDNLVVEYNVVDNSKIIDGYYSTKTVRESTQSLYGDYNKIIQSLKRELSNTNKVLCIHSILQTLEDINSIRLIYCIIDDSRLLPHSMYLYTNSYNKPKLLSYQDFIKKEIADGFQFN